MTPAERKTQDTNPGFCYWQVRKAEQWEKRNGHVEVLQPEVLQPVVLQPVILQPARGGCLSLLPDSIEKGLSLGLGIQGSHLAGAHIHEELQTFDVIIKGGHPSSPRDAQ